MRPRVRRVRLYPRHAGRPDWSSAVAVVAIAAAALFVIGMGVIVAVVGH